MENKLKNKSIKSFKIQHSNSNINSNLNSNLNSNINKINPLDDGFINIYFKSKISPEYYKTYISK